MSRPLRLHVPGGFYHVTLRGNHRQDIFRTPVDRELLDNLVGEALLELYARVHAYCWMPNHIHLVAQVSDIPLGKLVMRIASRYARKHQQDLKTTGHLFERRYHAVLVDADAYLLTLIRYIHLNPVRAGLAGAALTIPGRATTNIWDAGVSRGFARNSPCGCLQTIRPVPYRDTWRG